MNEMTKAIGIITRNGSVASSGTGLAGMKSSGRVTRRRNGVGPMTSPHSTHSMRLRPSSVSVLRYARTTLSMAAAMAMSLKTWKTSYHPSKTLAMGSESDRTARK